MTLTEYRQGTPEWLAARNEGIGSSDAPVICGESPYKSAYTLWTEKTGRVAVEEPDDQTARLFRIGHAMEPVLLDLYRAETGRTVRRTPRMLRHPRLSWMTASLDGRAGKRIVECKWTHARRWNEEAVPGDVQIQVQHAMEVAGAEVCDVVALVGADLRIVEVPRDPSMIASIMELEHRFWVGVQENVPPPVDGSDSTRQSLTRQHPADDGMSIVASMDMELVALQLLDAKARAKAMEDEIGTYSNALRAMIGDASSVVGQQFRATYRKNADSTTIGWQEVAHAYRRVIDDAKIEVDADAIQSLYSVTRSGPRVLRLTQG